MVCSVLTTMHTVTTVQQETGILTYARIVSKGSINFSMIAPASLVFPEIPRRVSCGFFLKRGSTHLPEASEHKGRGNEVRDPKSLGVVVLKNAEGFHARLHWGGVSD